MSSFNWYSSLKRSIKVSGIRENKSYLSLTQYNLVLTVLNKQNKPLMTHT